MTIVLLFLFMSARAGMIQYQIEKGTNSEQSPAECLLRVNEESAEK